MPDGGAYTGTPVGTVTDRTELLLSQVRWHLAGFDQKKLAENLRLLPQLLIFDKLQRAQNTLAEESLCLEKSASVTFTSGSGTEPTGFYRLGFIVLASGVSKKAIEIDIEEQDRLSRILTAQDTAGGNANPGDQYYYRYGGSIVTWPALDDGSYTLKYWGVPTSQIAQSQNPETPLYMDEALLYYAIKELAPICNRGDLVNLYEQKWMSERNRALESLSRKITVQRTIPVHDLG